MINNFKGTVNVIPAEQDYNANIRYHDENNSDLGVFLKSHLPFNDLDVTYLYDHSYSNSYPLVSFSHSTSPIGYQFENTGMCYKFSVKENGLQDIWWHNLNNSYVLDTSKLSNIPFYYIDLYGLTINSNNQSLSIEGDSSILSHMGIDRPKINLTNCTIVNGKNLLSYGIDKGIEIINGGGITLSAASGYDMTNFLKDTYDIYGSLNLSGITFEKDSQDNYYSLDKLDGMFDGSGNSDNPIDLNIGYWNGYITDGSNCNFGLDDSYYSNINASHWDFQTDGAEIIMPSEVHGTLADYSNMSITNDNNQTTINIVPNFYNGGGDNLFKISDVVCDGNVSMIVGSNGDIDTSNWTLSNADDVNEYLANIGGYNINASNWTIQNIDIDKAVSIVGDDIDFSNLTLSNCSFLTRFTDAINANGNLDMSGLNCSGVACEIGFISGIGGNDIDFTNWNLSDIYNDLEVNYGLITELDADNLDMSYFHVDSLQCVLYNSTIDDTLTLSNYNGYDWGQQGSGDTASFIDGCTIDTLDVSNWTNIGEYLCNFIGYCWDDMSISTIVGLDTWDVSNVIDFSYFIRVNSGSVDFSDMTAWRTMLSPLATYDHMLPNWDYVSDYPELNGWFDIYGTFYPYLGTVEEFEEITFKNIINSLSTVVNPEFGDCYNVRGSDSGGNFSAIQAWDGTKFILITKIYDSEQPGGEALYDWDFTTSLQDTNGVDVEFFSDSDDPTSITTTPATGQYIQGTGLSMESKYPLHIPVDMLSKSTSYRVEIDFASCTLNWASWNSGFICNINTSYDTNSIVSGLNSDFGCFTVDSYDDNSNFYSSESSITTTTFFANSTMKIINRLTNNNNVVWDFYKGDSLVFTTDEYQSDGITPVFWDNSSLQLPFAISGDGQEFAGIITGMRIYEES